MVSGVRAQSLGVNNCGLGVKGCKGVGFRF